MDIHDKATDEDHIHNEEDLQALFSAEAHRLLKTLKLSPSQASTHEAIVAGLATSHPGIFDRWVAASDTYAEAARYLFPFLNTEDLEMTDEQSGEYQKLYDDAVHHAEQLAQAVKAKA